MNIISNFAIKSIKQIEKYQFGIDKNMPKKMFIISGNICADRVRLGRALHKPPLTQEDLARKIQLMGYADITKVTISRIEKNQRHVCDAELRLLAQALNVTMEWLVGDSDLFNNR